jgi:hypothetical protein
MRELTQYQKLQLVRALTGYRIQLDVFEEVAGVMIDTGLVLILVRAAKYSARRGCNIITARGMKSVCIARTPGGWAHPAITVTWDEDEVETRVVADMPTTSPLERRLWEELCYRPGTPDSPRDSHARQLQGYYE